MQYYKDNYNITINDKNQPLLLSKVKKMDIQAQVSCLFLFLDY